MTDFYDLIVKLRAVREFRPEPISDNDLGAILEAARLLAHEGGMGAVQIAAVAKRADIAAGTVYRYFPAKTDLAEHRGALRNRAVSQTRGDGRDDPEVDRRFVDGHPARDIDEYVIGGEVEARSLVEYRQEQ